MTWMIDSSVESNQPMESMDSSQTTPPFRYYPIRMKNMLDVPEGPASVFQKHSEMQSDPDSSQILVLP